MLQYRIPAAGFASAAVIVICFVIALALISSLAAGKPRTFGALGVTMVFASTVLQALNGSMAGAYGRDTVVYGAGSIVVGALTGGGVVFVALAVVRSRRARSGRDGR